MIYKVNNKYKYRFKGNTKKVLSQYQTEPDRYNLNHLYNFLQKNIGKEWDYIYSILKQRIPSGLWEFVEKTVKLTDIITYDRSIKFQVINGILLPIDYIEDTEDNLFVKKICLQKGWTLYEIDTDFSFMRFHKFIKTKHRKINKLTVIKNYHAFYADEYFNRTGYAEYEFVFKDKETQDYEGKPYRDKIFDINELPKILDDIEEYFINKHFYYEQEGIDESGDPSSLWKPLYKRGNKERVSKSKFTVIDNKSNYLNFIK